MSTRVPPADPPDGGTGTPTKIAPMVLWNTVVAARATHAQQRQLPQSASAMEARVGLLHALEAYVESLAERGWPIPYAIRDELRIQQLSCARDRQRWGPTCKARASHGN